MQEIREKLEGLENLIFKLIPDEEDDIVNRFIELENLLVKFKDQMDQKTQRIKELSRFKDIVMDSFELQLDERISKEALRRELEEKKSELLKRNKDVQELESKDATIESLKQELEKKDSEIKELKLPKFPKEVTKYDSLDKLNKRIKDLEDSIIDSGKTLAFKKKDGSTMRLVDVDFFEMPNYVQQLMDNVKIQIKKGGKNEQSEIMLIRLKSIKEELTKLEKLQLYRQMKYGK